MRPAFDIKVTNSTSAFNIALAKGDKVWDINSGVYYAATAPVAANETLTTQAGSFVIINAAAASDPVEVISLPSGGDVQLRINAAIEGTDYPNGWVLTASGINDIDLNVQHGLLKRVHSVTVWSKNGDEELELYGAARYSQVRTPDSNNIKIESLSIVPERIQIYILFK